MHLHSTEAVKLITWYASRAGGFATLGSKLFNTAFNVTHFYIREISPQGESLKCIKCKHEYNSCLIVCLHEKNPFEKGVRLKTTKCIAIILTPMQHRNLLSKISRRKLIEMGTTLRRFPYAKNPVLTFTTCGKVLKVICPSKIEVIWDCVLFA